MQNRRSRVIWLIAIGVAFVFILDPFDLFDTSNLPEVEVNRDVEQLMEEYLLSAPQASSYVVDLFADRDIVLMGETGYIKEQLDFLAALIPELDAAGIRHLGFQYANPEQQDEIDALVSGSSFDETLANRILFEHMVIMGYEELRNVFRAAWQVNRGKAEDADRFRIVGIGYTPDYSLIQDEDDVNDPEILRRIFEQGVEDEIMARNVIRMLVEPGHKAVVYTRLRHAFTGFRQVEYERQMDESGFPNQKRMGNTLADRLGNRVATVVFHSPVHDSRSRIGYGYPVGGLMERAFERLSDGRSSAGFTTSASPYADAPITSDVLTEGLEEDLTLGRFTDGYLLISEIDAYSPLTPIPGFISEANLDEARSEFPGADPGDVGAADLNEFIAGTAQSMEQILNEFE
ncbi:MAG: hypothetical protein ACOC0E_01910 [Spirochaetota bacterium]